MIFAKPHYNPALYEHDRAIVRSEINVIDEPLIFSSTLTCGHVVPHSVNGVTGRFEGRAYVWCDHCWKETQKGERDASAK